MSFGHALYYPHINLRTNNWLKCALLYWDKLSRIVPTGVDPEDSEDVIELRNETEFIDDYAPAPMDISKTFHEFGKYVDQIIASESFLEDIFERHCESNIFKYPEFLLPIWRHSPMNFRWNPAAFRNLMHNSDFRREVFRDLMHNSDFRRKVFQDLTRSSKSYIHVGKLDPRLKEKLYILGLAVPGKHDREGFVKVDGSFGYSYMSYLARSISDHHQFPMVTDNPMSFAEATGFAGGNPDRLHRDDFKYRLGHLLVAQFLPKNLHAVSLKKLIGIRKKYADERNQFLVHIQELCHEIPKITSERSLHDALRIYSKKLCADAKTLQKVYESQHIDIATKFLSISVPTSIAATTEFVPVEWKPFSLAAGLLFGGVSTIRSIQKERMKLQEMPLSYLLHIQAETEPTVILGAIIKRVDGLLK